MIPTDCSYFVLSQSRFQFLMFYDTYGLLVLRTLAILVSAYDVSMIPTDCDLLRTLAILVSIHDVL